MWSFRRKGNERGAFLSSCSYLILMLVGAAAALYSNLLLSTTDPALNITIFNAFRQTHARHRAHLVEHRNRARRRLFRIFVPHVSRENSRVLIGTPLLARSARYRPVVYLPSFESRIVTHHRPFYDLGQGRTWPART